MEKVTLFVVVNKCLEASLQVAAHERLRRQHRCCGWTFVADVHLILSYSPKTAKQTDKGINGVGIGLDILMRCCNSNTL